MDDIEFLAEAIRVGTSQAIENQEAQGQRDLVASSKLPKKSGQDRSVFEEMGIVFGDDVDDLFVSVTLPKGWTKEASDHSMHSSVYDDKGRERIGVFYKAAFYDRKASMHANTRYNYDTKYPTDSTLSGDDYVNACFDYPVDMTLGSAVFGERVQIPGSPSFNGKESYKQCQAWLEENYPDYKNPAKYWD